MRSAHSALDRGAFSVLPEAVLWIARLVSFMTTPWWAFGRQERGSEL